MANVIAAVALPCVPAVVVVSAVPGVPAAAVLLTDVYVPGVPALAEVTAVASSLLLLMSFLPLVFPTILAPLLLLASLLWLTSLL